VARVDVELGRERAAVPAVLPHDDRAARAVAREPGKRLLLHRAAWNRLAERIRAASPHVQPLLMDDAGVVSDEAGALVGVPLDFDLAWASGDVLASPAAQTFFGLLGSTPSLTWVQSGLSGTDLPPLQALLRRGVRLTTSHGQAPGIAEFVLAAVLDHFQAGPERRAARARGEWRRIRYREIGGTTWLLVGYGAVGQAIASRVRALGVSILAVRASPQPHPDALRVGSAAALPDFLPQADVVVLCAPHRPETHRIAGVDFFAAMKPGAFLVNVGRGALVNEAALLEGLGRGSPAAAALDVFDAEPLPQGHPLWGHPKVSLTAHVAGMASGQGARNDQLFLENLLRLQRGEPLRHSAVY